MKKIIALLMTALMLFTVHAALAEGEQLAPLYKTVGEAMEDSSEGRVISGGIPGEYYAVITLKDGTYYRSIAYVDEKLKELEAAEDALDYTAEDYFDKFEAARDKVDEYIKTLPIAYSEAFTAKPLTEEEMASWKGKKLSELVEEGFEIGSNGTDNDENEEMIIFYDLRYGVFDYSCVMDADYDQYEAAQENDTEGDLTVREMKLLGITEWGFDRRFHTDGTVEEQRDPLAELSGILEELGALIQRAQAGEDVDFKAFAESMKEQYPEFAEMVDVYMTLCETYGIEGLASMMTPAE